MVRQRVELAVPRLPAGAGELDVAGAEGGEDLAELVIAALGFDPEDLVTLFNEPALPVTRWGTLKIDWNTMMTAMPGP